MSDKTEQIHPSMLFSEPSSTTYIHPVARCTECGGVKYGYLQTTADFYCYCENFQLKGWTCPVCGAGVNPIVPKCPCTEGFTVCQHHD